jgi:undecaprenyl-diphosphatase
MFLVASLDQDICDWFNAHRTHTMTQLMRDVTALGGVAVLTLVVLFALGLLLAVRRYRTAVFVLIAVLGGSLLADVVKRAIGRDRPEVLDPELKVLLPHSASFPSGHSMLSAVVYLTLALLVAGRLQGRRIHMYLIGWSLLLTFLIGLSRMYLGMHYFTDVLGGWMAGLAWALLCRWLEDHWATFRERAVEVDEGNGETAMLSPGGSAESPAT